MHDVERRMTLLCVALFLAALGLYAYAGVGAAPAAKGDRVYSVATLQATVARDPQQWAGRVVQVRALAEPCQAWGSLHSALRCTTLHPDLVDPEGADLVNPLPLVLNTDNHSLLGFLHQLLLVNRLVPAAPVPAWDTLQTYRVRLQAIATRHCDIESCVAAVLDASAI
jgi:hypothetical protein